MTIGSLFSGIGGLELGLELAGLGPVVWQVELDPNRRAVLEKRWPRARRFNDVRAFKPPSGPRILCGGFPCRGFSSAGSRRGFSNPESALWFEFARVVRECRPDWVVVENVAQGEWIEQVRADLDGYSCTPIGLSPRDLGLRHDRRRVFVIAHADSQGESLGAINEEVAGVRETAAPLPEAEPSTVDLPDGLPWRMAALGDAVCVPCAYVIGLVIRGLS